MSRLDDFERLIDDKLRTLFRGTADPEKRELIEVYSAILDDIAQHEENLPRGRRTFTYVQVIVRVLVPSPERRRSYEAALIEGGALARDVRSRLNDDEVELSPRFRVTVELVDELAGERGFDVEYVPESTAAEQRAPSTIPTIWLTVVSGKADRDEYRFRKARVNLGRLHDVLDVDQRPIRRNDVAFVEVNEGPNVTVSRTHAHIEYDPATGHFRVFDDRSARGTAVFREGTTVRVPRGLSKGVQLRDGDEIALGQARVRFELTSGGETA